MLVSLLAFVLVIAICVISHESGHYLAAKWRNVYVHEFSFGMGFSLFSKQIGETLYSVRAFPIGGYVKLEGEDEVHFVSDIPQERALYAKKPWERLVILAAGIAVNLLLAWLLFSSYLFANGSWDLQTATIGKLLENSPACKAGLQKGDIITKINNAEIKRWADISKNIRNSKTDTFEIEYMRNGQKNAVKLIIPAAKNGRLLGITPQKISYSLPQACANALNFSWKMSCGIISAIFNMITGRSKEEIAGPVGIAAMSGEAARGGFWAFMSFLGIINLNLGLVNLLPLPALDGGRILFTLAEMLTGKKMPARFEAAIHTAGFVLLIALTIFITGMDLLKLLKR